MPSENLIKLKAELEAARDVLEPQIEGLADFNSLDLQEKTKVQVAELYRDLTRRRDLIIAALTSLVNLDTDKYPEVPTRVVLNEIYLDLKANVDTIQAAFKKFAPQEMAATLDPQAGDPIPKP